MDTENLIKLLREPSLWIFPAIKEISNNDLIAELLRRGHKVVIDGNEFKMSKIKENTLSK